ncbi:hypothetical protein DFQ29_001822 [Apophysomyces sp. BC1021]|nr:hypothetical protein DFQ29_001822 [Apophysomyces sp. BC1021]
MILVLVNWKKNLQDGSEYCGRLKRKYANIAENDEDDDPVTPMEEPSKLSAFVHNSGGSNECDQNGVIMEFVKHYEAQIPGRIQ